MSNMIQDIATYIDFRTLMTNAAGIFMKAVGHYHDSFDTTLEYQEANGVRSDYKVCITATTWGRCGDSDDHEYFYIPVELIYDKTEAIENFAENVRIQRAADKRAAEEQAAARERATRLAQFKALQKEFGDSK